MKIDKSIYDLYSDKKVDEKFSIRQESGKLKYYIKKECSCGKVFITRADDNREEYECCDCAKITSGVKRRGRKAANRHSNKESVIMASAKRVFLFYKRADQNDLDFETFMILVKQNCFYCGIEPSNKTHVGIRKDGTSRELKKRKTTNGEIYYTRIWASDFEEAYFIYNGLDRSKETT